MVYSPQNQIILRIFAVNTKAILRKIASNLRKYAEIRCFILRKLNFLKIRILKNGFLKINL